MADSTDHTGPDAQLREVLEDLREDPDPPGRGEGHDASYRREPEQIDRRVEVPIEGCPECGEAVTDVRPIRQVAQERPPIEPEVVEVVTYRGECRECGTVETSHPLKTTEATGAAGPTWVLGRRQSRFFCGSVTA